MEVVGIELVVKATELKEITKSKCQQRREKVQRLGYLTFLVLDVKEGKEEPAKEGGEPQTVPLP